MGFRFSNFVHEKSTKPENRFRGVTNSKGNVHQIACGLCGAPCREVLQTVKPPLAGPLFEIPSIGGSPRCMSTLWQFQSRFEEELKQPLRFGAVSYEPRSFWCLHLRSTVRHMRGQSLIPVFGPRSHLIYEIRCAHQKARYPQSGLFGGVEKWLWFSARKAAPDLRRKTRSPTVGLRVFRPRSGTAFRSRNQGLMWP